MSTTQVLLSSTSEKPLVPPQSWDGSGANWLKIESGVLHSIVQFTDMNQNTLTTTIPSTTPPGEYLVCIEQVGLHVAGAPHWYISCAQIDITGGGGGNPPKVSIPGYASQVTQVSLSTSIGPFPLPTQFLAPVPAADKLSASIPLGNP